jgi:hypothetical protein
MYLFISDNKKGLLYSISDMTKKREMFVIGGIHKTHWPRAHLSVYEFRHQSSLQVSGLSLRHLS